MTNPHDLGYEQEGYDLPPMQIIEHIVKTNNYTERDGQLMFAESGKQSLTERRQARRDSLNERVAKAAEIANSYDGQTLVWCDLNDESEKLAKAIHQAVEVRGSDSDTHKTDAMMGFTTGDVHRLVSKPSIAGWGMNWQNCNNLIFTGLSDSFESYYQAVRRCWRYGQKKPVNVHIVISDAEGAVKANIERKQADAQRMTQELVKYTKDILTAEIHSTARITESYTPQQEMCIPKWLRGDAA